jgi:endonuclease V
LKYGQPPDMIMVDGFGILHPLGCGSATMLGVQLGIPTIGIGKSLNYAGCDDTEKDVKDELIHGVQQIAYLHRGHVVVGAAYRNSIQNRKPIYISIGHLVSLETAIQVTEVCCTYRIPEPIRQADFISRECIRRNERM